MRIKRFNENKENTSSRLDVSIEYLMESLRDFNKDVSLYKCYVDEDNGHYSDFKTNDEYLLDNESYMIGYNITIETEFIPKTHEEENFDSTPIEFSFNELYDNIKDLNSTFDFIKSFISDLEGIKHFVSFYEKKIILNIQVKHLYF
jgi:hypothetical protein